ncbi:MAG: cupin domain-containing protein [Geminicoccaceae bacterium]
MDIHRSDTATSLRLPADWVTGTGWLDRIVEAPPPARVNVVRLTFEPGARTFWHRHPVGQTLHILFGLGLVQSRGGPLRRLRPGDTVWIAPGEEHWHGATPETAVMQLAVYPSDAAGVSTVWLEEVPQAVYGGQVAQD